MCVKVETEFVTVGVLTIMDGLRQWPSADAAKESFVEESREF